MTESNNTPMIYAAMAQCIADIGIIGVGKNGNNTFQKFNYRSIDDILSAFNKVFAKNSIFLTTQIREKNLTSFEIKSSLTYKLDLWLEYTFYCPDGSFVKGDTFVSNTGKDVSKLTGQITSYALKEYLVKSFCVPTEGTDDLDSRDENGLPTLESVVGKPYTRWKTPKDAATWALKEYKIDPDKTKEIIQGLDVPREIKSQTFYEHVIANYAK